MQNISGQESVNLVVGALDANTRLDVFLWKKGPFISRQEAKRAIKLGNILVNDTPSKPAYSLKEGDSVSGIVPERESPLSRLRPESIPLRVTYEDEELIVIDKPAGLVVHPGAGNYSGTLVHALLSHCPSLAPQGSPLRPGIVHRLDKDTSGLLVVAKTAPAYQSFITQFKENRVDKKYYALVYGSMKPTGRIETGIERHPRDRKKMHIALERGKKAITEWKVKEFLSFFSFLEVTIKTGRTHQIRAHFSYLNHPIVGDHAYGGKRRVKTVADTEIRAETEKIKRQLLHSFYLSFHHPKTQRRVSFTSPLPADFESFLDFLRKKNDR